MSHRLPRPFRAVFLARVDQLLGAGRAMLMTSVIFGIGHWFGHPSGPSGVVLAFVAGWVLGTVVAAALIAIARLRYAVRVR